MGLIRTSSFAVGSSKSEPTPAEVRTTLWTIYRAAIRRYVPRDEGILARSIERTDDGWIINEPCALNTAEMLKAAFLMESMGVAHPLDARRLMDRMMANHAASADYEVVALMLWAAAIGDSGHAPALWNLLCERLARDATQSMPLAWTLCAVCEYVRISRERSAVSALARELFDRLCANQSPTGLFYASARRVGWLRRRRSDTTLSSQTYPILAMASYGSAFGADNALSRARRCADRLCTLQGSQGQWWWRYDARRGAITERYPVYAVNQDAAIPAAFGRLQRELGDRRYESAIARGLIWLGGSNEIGQTLWDEPARFVVRSLDKQPDSFHLSWEMYAYQPARYLYALLSDHEWAREVAS